jgi:hypothetical protein
MVAASRATSVPLAAHGDADVGSAQCRRLSTPVLVTFDAAPSWCVE